MPRTDPLETDPGRSPTVGGPLAAFADEGGALSFPEDAVPLGLPAQVFDGAVLHRAHLLHGQDRLIHATSPAALPLGAFVELRLTGDWVVVCAVQRVDQGPCYWLEPIEPLHRVSLA